MSRHGLLRSVRRRRPAGCRRRLRRQRRTAAAGGLQPGEKAIFAVSSELLVGQREAMLIDAQFSRADAEQLVKRIQASGKTLSTIYISHGDPDFYFGLDVLKAAFPRRRSSRRRRPSHTSRRPRTPSWPTGADPRQRADVAGGAGAAEGRPVEAGRPCPEGGRPEGAEPGPHGAVDSVAEDGGRWRWWNPVRTSGPPIPRPASRQAWWRCSTGSRRCNRGAWCPAISPARSRRAWTARFTRDYLKALEAELPKARFRRAGRGDEAPLPEPAGRGRPASAKVLKGEMQWP